MPFRGQIFFVDHGRARKGTESRCGPSSHPPLVPPRMASTFISFPSSALVITHKFREIGVYCFSPEGTSYRSPGWSEARAKPWVLWKNFISPSGGGIEEPANPSPFLCAIPSGFNVFGSADPGFRSYFAAPWATICRHYVANQMHFCDLLQCRILKNLWVMTRAPLGNAVPKALLREHAETPLISRSGHGSEFPSGAWGTRGWLKRASAAHERIGVPQQNRTGFTGLTRCSAQSC